MRTHTIRRRRQALVDACLAVSARLLRRRGACPRLPPGGDPSGNRAAARGRRRPHPQQSTPHRDATSGTSRTHPTANTWDEDQIPPSTNQAPSGPCLSASRRGGNPLASWRRVEESLARHREAPVSVRARCRAEARRSSAGVDSARGRGPTGNVTRSSSGEPGTSRGAPASRPASYVPAKRGLRAGSANRRETPSTRSVEMTTGGVGRDGGGPVRGTHRRQGGVWMAGRGVE